MRRHSFYWESRGLRHLARCPGDDYVLVLFEERARIAPMARSHAAVKRPPAPSWPQPSTPAGGFARRAGHGAGRPSAVELAAPTDAAVAARSRTPPAVTSRSRALLLMTGGRASRSCRRSRPR